MYQQGDVLIKRVDKIQGKKTESNILADGEMTGHAHRVTSGNTCMYRDGNDLYLDVLSDIATITHEEHNPCTVERGIYKIEIVQEYDHFLEEARNVQD